MPAELQTAITAAGGLTEIGHAVTTASAAALLGPGWCGRTGTANYVLSTATENGTFNGNPAVSSRPRAIEQINLYSEGDVLWGIAGGDLQTGRVCSRPMWASDGRVWLVQFEAIAHNVDGSTAAAYDDPISVLGVDIRFTLQSDRPRRRHCFGCVEHADPAYFQDDGPSSASDTNWTIEDSRLPRLATCFRRPCTQEILHRRLALLTQRIHSALMAAR